MKPTIISGVCKGMKLEVPEGDLTRPTSSRAREALFSSLQNRIEGAKTLDLFAGSGAFGLECLSRGASAVLLVENNRLALRSIEKNFQELESRFIKQNLSPPSFRLLAMNVEKAGSQLKKLGIVPEGIDIIFADPPYKQMDVCLSPVMDLAKTYLSKVGVLVFEYSSERKMNWVEYLNEYNLSEFKILQEKRYGLVSFVFFAKVNQ